jgi:hypothetical protein
MLRLASVCLLACSFAASAQAEDAFTKRFAVDIDAEGEAGPGSGPTGTCGSYSGGDLQGDCEYGPGSFVNWDLESEYGPGDREGGMPVDDPSDGYPCYDYEWGSMYTCT